MNKNIIYLSGTLCAIFLFLIIYLLKPDENNNKPQSKKELSQTDYSNTLSASGAVLNNQTQYSEQTSFSHSSTVKLNQNREKQIDDLRAFFESQPTDEKQIFDHILEAAYLNPIEISTDISPYLNSKNIKIQTVALSALNNAMVPSQTEVNNPDFIDHGRRDLRNEIGKQVNELFSKTDNDEIKQKVISIYDSTNPSKEDTQKMVNYVLETNQNKTPSDMEIYYLKTSFAKYPDLKPNNLQSYQYAEINKKL